jgi:hypothetical protein
VRRIGPFLFLAYLARPLGRFVALRFLAVHSIDVIGNGTEIGSEKPQGYEAPWATRSMPAGGISRGLTKKNCPNKTGQSASATILLTRFYPRRLRCGLGSNLNTPIFLLNVFL